jgi:hypothetical protein
LTAALNQAATNATRAAQVAKNVSANATTAKNTTNLAKVNSTNVIEQPKKVNVSANVTANVSQPSII